MAVYQILYKTYLLKGRKNRFSAKIQRLVARSTFLTVVAAYLVIMQIASQLVCSMATEAQKMHHQPKCLVICRLFCTWLVAVLIQE